MSRKIFVIAFMLLSLVTATIPVMVVVGQEPTPEPIVSPTPEVTFAWVLLAWLIYAALGLLANMTATPSESFDAVKFASSLLSMVITFLLALILKLTPGAIITQYGPLIDGIATVVLNTGPGLLLIYAILRFYRFVMNAKAKMEAAKSAAGPGPPHPS